MTSHTFFYTAPANKRGRKPNCKKTIPEQSSDAAPLPVGTECNILSGISSVDGGANKSAESTDNMRNNKERAVTADHLLTAEEAAAVLQIHPKTLRYWVRIGLLRKVPVGTVRYRIARSEIDRFIREREMDASKEAAR